MNDRALINVVTENNRHLNITPLNICGSVGLTPRVCDMEVHNTAKRNFSDLKIDIRIREVERNKIVLFGSMKSGIKGSQKHHVWIKITAAVHSFGVGNQTPAEIWIFDLYILDM